MRVYGYVGDAELLCPECAREQGRDGEDGEALYSWSVRLFDSCGGCHAYLYGYAADDAMREAYRARERETGEEAEETAEREGW